MPARTVHVVGAGVAGLVAALHLARAGREVCLHEAAGIAGGRCGDDAGAHVIRGADAAALGFLDAIGARRDWLEPEPDGLPLLDLANGRTWRLAAAPRGWRDPARRPDGLGPGGALALLGMAAGITDRPAAAVMAKHPALLRGLVEPLALDALNTPVAEASSARLGQVLRRLCRAGGARMLVAREGTMPNLVAPALAAIREAGGTVRQGAHLRAMTVAENRVVALHVGPDSLVIGAEAAVILAVPPWEAARLVPGLRVPECHAPARLLHFAAAGDGAVRRLGVLGGLVQSMLVRPGGVSATVSAPHALAATLAEDVAAHAWAECRMAAQAFGLGAAWKVTPPPWRTAHYPRATLFHGVGLAPVAPRQPMRNLALAGDWTWPGLPCSIEGAALSGMAAARAMLRGR